MSIIGAQTYNPIMESKKQLVKERYLDFNHDNHNITVDYINAIIEDHNNYKSNYVLNYKAQFSTELN